MTNQPWKKWVGRPIIDVVEANSALTELYIAAANEQCIVARGRVRLPSILPGFALVIHEFWPRGGELGDVQDMKGKGLIYSAAFLRQMADTAGLKAAGTTRHDDGADPYLRDMEVLLQGQDLLLRHRVWSGRYELDLREGNVRAASVSKPGDLRSQREHISQRASTGAYSRAVVEALAIPRSFKKPEHAYLPILIPCMEVNAASAPAEVLTMMSQSAVYAAMGAFGPPPTTGRQAAVPPAQEAALPAPDARFAPDLDPDDEVVDEPPFDGPDEDDDVPEPPLEDMAPPDRPINAEEAAELKRLGLYRQGVLSQHGWTEGPVMLSVYENALATHYRSQGGGAR